MKLPENLCNLIHNYFLNREKQKNGIKWDKKTDLDLISKTTLSEGFDRFQACAGTFWLTKNGQTYKIDEQNFDLDILGEIAIKGSNPMSELIDY